MKFIAQRKWEPVATFYMRVYKFVKWLTPHACETTFTEIYRALFVQKLKYPLVVIREDDLEKVLIHMLKVERQVVQGYLVLCVDDSDEEEEDNYDPLAVSPWGPLLSLNHLFKL